MPAMTENQIRNIYANCNRAGVNMEDLLRLCLDPMSGITVDGLRDAGYQKIDLLEQRYNMEAEEKEWAACQDSIPLLESFIKKCEEGIYSGTHHGDAIARLRELARENEEKEWREVRMSQDIHKTEKFIDNVRRSIYSDTHLKEATILLEELDWREVKNSSNPLMINDFIEKCQRGVYSPVHLKEAENLFESLEFNLIVCEWTSIMDESDIDSKIIRLKEFADRYSSNGSEVVRSYVAKARETIKRLEDAKFAERDWIIALDENTIKAYSNFIKNHPYSEHVEEAKARKSDLKGDLLTDIRIHPCNYSRVTMSEYIMDKILTYEDLVDRSEVLTPRGYEHIKKYPTLEDEQRERGLPMSTIENPVSLPGKTDVYFFGVAGSGKTCVLSGILSLSGKRGTGFKYDPKGPGGGGNYAIALKNYARDSMLPPGTPQEYVQLIDAEINDSSGNKRDVSLIEMSGEKTGQFSTLDNPTQLDLLGPGAESLLSNDNNKMIFFVIDPVNSKEISINGKKTDVYQSDVLNNVACLLSKSRNIMKKITGIHVILTKSDTLGDVIDEEVTDKLFVEQGYDEVMQSLDDICKEYGINKQTGYCVGIYPFCLGKFMPGDVYAFDETDSVKILNVMRENIPSIRKKTLFGSINDFFNS